MFRLDLRPVGGSQAAPQYRIDLLNGDYANIIGIANGWSLTIHPHQQASINRGLFGSPDDARALLEAEVIGRLTTTVNSGAQGTPASR